MAQNPKIQGKYKRTGYLKKLASLSKLSILLLKNQLIAKNVNFYIFLTFLYIEA